MNRRGREVTDRCAEIRAPRLSRFHRYESHASARSRERVYHVEIQRFISPGSHEGWNIPREDEIRIIRSPDRTSVIPRLPSLAGIDARYSIEGADERLISEEN